MAPAGHLVDPVLNLAAYRREHEKFYEQAPLEDAAKPAQIRCTAARRTAIKPNLSSSRLLFLLVRHADAGDKHRWQGPDSLRPLSPAGQAEAAGLVIGLDDYPIWRILTSPTLRCHQTVQPLARDRRLRIEHESALGVGADLASVLALLEDPRLQDTVLCTHGELIGQVLTRLVADGLAVDQPLQWPKGSTWLLDGANGRLTHARYLPPLVLALPRARHRHRGARSLRRMPVLGQRLSTEIASAPWHRGWPGSPARRRGRRRPTRSPGRGRRSALHRPA
jgi:8-oxo-dGTP diphosphatase